MSLSSSYIFSFSLAFLHFLSLIFLSSFISFCLSSSINFTILFLYIFLPSFLFLFPVLLAFSAFSLRLLHHSIFLNGRRNCLTAWHAILRSGLFLFSIRSFMLFATYMCIYWVWKKWDTGCDAYKGRMRMPHQNQVRHSIIKEMCCYKKTTEQKKISSNKTNTVHGLINNVNQTK